MGTISFVSLLLVLLFMDWMLYQWFAHVSEEKKRTDEIIAMSRNRSQPWSIAMSFNFCVICQEPFEVGASTLKLSCSHNFHTACIEEFLLKGQAMKPRNCPVCRQLCLACDICAEEAHETFNETYMMAAAL